MPRPILKWTALTVVTLAVGFAVFAWLHANTPLGCYVEEEYPPPKPGTPEYAAMQAAAPHFPKFFKTDLKNVRIYATPYWRKGDTFEFLSNPKDSSSSQTLKTDEYWFIVFHPRHDKSLFGCDTPHMDGEWVADVLKRDLMVMNQKDYQD